MNLDETILKAQQTADMLHSDIREAFTAVTASSRHGMTPSLMDKATEAYLLDVLELVIKVRWKLAEL